MVLIALSWAGDLDIPQRQASILEIAWNEGQKVGHPLTVQSFVKQESDAGAYKYTRYGIIGDGKDKPIGSKSYGVTQIRLKTAKIILKAHPELGHFEHDEQLIVALLIDDEFNIRLAATYFSDLLKLFKGNWEKAVLAYNVGPGTVKKYGLSKDPNHYLKSIKQHVANLKRAQAQ